MFEDLKKGDVVTVPIDFSDFSGSKVRPMLVLYHDPETRELTVAYITSKVPSSPGPYDILIPLGTPSSIKAGLDEDSMLKARWITVIKRVLVLRKIGEADADLRARVNKTIAACLTI
ncbi:MAG TPA: type II toxin-antitoxin system PemK/MazF family toxin [Methanotrichaceae archaeon]|nr:type II toxin-antitoxin system PemK/MazF family toxin [Methanotrichaceae archaeon]